MTAPTVDPGLTQPPPTPSPTPSGTSSPAAPPQPPPTEFRFGPEAEEWMRGKTPAEVSALARQLAQVAAQALQQPAYQQAPVPQPPAPPSPPAIDPNDLVTGRQLLDAQSQVAQQIRDQAAALAAPAITMAAQASLDAIRSKYPKEFGKYGPEIYGQLTHVPRENWTIDNLDTVVNVVRSKHLPELIREGAEQLAASPEFATRATGASPTLPTGSSPSPATVLNDEQRASLARRGLTPEVIRDFCLKNNLSEQKWYERYGKNAVGDAV